MKFSDSFSIKYFLTLILNSILLRIIVRSGLSSLFQIFGKDVNGSFSAKLVRAKGTKRSSLFRRMARLGSCLLFSFDSHSLDSECGRKPCIDCCII